MSLELGPWMMPVGVTIISFAFAFMLSVPGASGQEPWMRWAGACLLFGMAAVASGCVWFAWATVLR